MKHIKKFNESLDDLNEIEDYFVSLLEDLPQIKLNIYEAIQIREYDPSTGLCSGRYKHLPPFAAKNHGPLVHKIFPGEFIEVCMTFPKDDKNIPDFSDKNSHIYDFLKDSYDIIWFESYELKSLTNGGWKVNGFRVCLVFEKIKYINDKKIHDI